MIILVSATFDKSVTVYHIDSLDFLLTLWPVTRFVARYVMTRNLFHASISMSFKVYTAINSKENTDFGEKGGTVKHVLSALAWPFPICSKGALEELYKPHLSLQPHSPCRWHTIG